jgi:hypothetical protein
MIKQQQRRKAGEPATYTATRSPVESRMTTHERSEREPQMVCHVQVVDAQILSADLTPEIADAPETP